MNKHYADLFFSTHPVLISEGACSLRGRVVRYEQLDLRNDQLWGREENGTALLGGKAVSGTALCLMSMIHWAVY